MSVQPVQPVSVTIPSENPTFSKLIANGFELFNFLDEADRSEMALVSKKTHQITTAIMGE